MIFISVARRTEAFDQQLDERADFGELIVTRKLFITLRRDPKVLQAARASFGKSSAARASFSSFRKSAMAPTISAASAKVVTIWPIIGTSSPAASVPMRRARTTARRARRMAWRMMRNLLSRGFLASVTLFGSSFSAKRTGASLFAPSLGANQPGLGGVPVRGCFAGSHSASGSSARAYLISASSTSMLSRAERSGKSGCAGGRRRCRQDTDHRHSRPPRRCRGLT